MKSKDQQRHLFESAGPGLESAPAKRLRVVGLFAGIGGLERGLHRSGHETALLCEIEPTAQAVLRARFPGVPLHDDVTTLATLPAGTQLVAAGFPCQDLSQAGKTKGVDALTRDGHVAREAGLRSGLVGQVFRLIEQQPVDWVLLENVPFMLQLAKGRALDLIIDALEALGYAWAYRVVNAQAFGRPQRRERVYLLASRVNDPRAVLLSEDVGDPEATQWAPGQSFGFYWTEGIRGLGAAVEAVPTLKGGSTIGIPSPPAILMPNGMVVTPDIRDAERLQGFPANWTKPAEAVAKRGARWKLVGNAVNVDAAAWIGKRLSQPRSFVARSPRELARGSRWPRVAWSEGGRRFTDDISAWPDHRACTPIHEFLNHEVRSLSERATAGFLSRTKKSGLRFPEGFLAAVQAHLERMMSEVPTAA